MNFDALSYYVVPVKQANRIYLEDLTAWAHKPKRDGGKRKLSNMAVHTLAERMEKFKDAWHLLKDVRD